MRVNCNYIISNGLKTNKLWGEEKNKFWMKVHRNCYNWNRWKQTNGEEWKNLFRFFFPHPILYTSIMKNNASKREDDESMVDSLPVSWTGQSDSVRKALLQVVRRHLTPPPSSTNVERLFSIGGLTATDHRAALAGEKLDQILFLRENALMANFKLGWEWSVINCCTYNISWNLE